MYLKKKYHLMINKLDFGFEVNIEVNYPLSKTPF